MCEDGALRKILGHKKEWTKWHSEEVSWFILLTNIRVIQLRRVRWAETVARVGEKKHATLFFGLGGGEESEGEAT
jgi:hypothetical protein